MRPYGLSQPGFRGCRKLLSEGSGCKGIRPTRAHDVRAMQPTSQIAAGRGLGSYQRDEVEVGSAHRLMASRPLRNTLAARYLNPMTFAECPCDHSIVIRCA